MSQNDLKINVKAVLDEINTKKNLEKSINNITAQIKPMISFALDALEKEFAPKIKESIQKKNVGRAYNSVALIIMNMPTVVQFLYEV